MLYSRSMHQTSAIRVDFKARLATSVIVGAVAAFGLAASNTVEARTNSPIAQVGASLQDLFSPPRRSRRAVSKRSHSAAAAPGQRHSRKPQGQEQPGAGARLNVEAKQAQEKPSFAPASRAEASGSRDRAVPQPPPRPAEAPPRREGTAKLAPARRSAIEPRPAQPAPEQKPAPPPDNKGSAEEPGSDAATAASPPPPSACQLRLTADLAVMQPLPSISSGECVAEDVVRLDAVMGKDGRRIAITPPATLRCSMAESIVHWVREDVAAVAADFGAPLKSLTVDTSYECRSRNHVAGAKLSEHGHANAVDLRAFTLANNTIVVLTDKAVRKEAREQLRASACARFTTVLGPGSDGYHENHIHLDRAERRNNYRICQWDMRDQEIAAVPLPPERPAGAPPRSGTEGKSSRRD